MRALSLGVAPEAQSCGPVLGWFYGSNEQRSELVLTSTVKAFGTSKWGWNDRGVTKNPST